MDLEKINEIKNPPMISIDGKGLVKGYCEIYLPPRIQESQKDKDSQQFGGWKMECEFPKMGNGY
jgi:hypothetical protein